MVEVNPDDYIFAQKFRKKVNGYQWNNMIFNPKNKTFRPIVRADDPSLQDKVDANPHHYPNGSEFVAVMMAVHPDSLKNKFPKLRWIFSVTLGMLVIQNGKVKSADDQRSLTVNWYVEDLRKRIFTMKDLQTLVKVTYKDLIRTNALNGISITKFRERLEQVKLERAQKKAKKKSKSGG